MRLPEDAQHPVNEMILALNDISRDTDEWTVITSTFVVMPLHGSPPLYFSGYANKPMAISGWIKDTGTPLGVFAYVKRTGGKRDVISHSFRNRYMNKAEFRELAKTACKSFHMKVL